MKVNAFDGVLFDMDGVIFDSERASLKCWNLAGKEHGITEDEMWQIKLQITGTTAANSRKVITDRFGMLPGFDYTNFRAKYEAYYSELLEKGEIPLKPGAKELLIWLREHGKKVGLASSTYTEKIMRQLKRVGIDVLFDLIIGGDQIRHSKPDPEIYLLSMERLHLSVERTYGIEDSYNGIRSLSAAHIHPIMVPDILPVTDEMLTLAMAILPDLNKVREMFEGRTLAQDGACASGNVVRDRQKADEC